MLKLAMSKKTFREEFLENDKRSYGFEDQLQ